MKIRYSFFLLFNSNLFSKVIRRTWIIRLTGWGTLLLFFSYWRYSISIRIKREWMFKTVRIIIIIMIINKTSCMWFILCFWTITTFINFKYWCICFKFSSFWYCVRNLSFTFFLLKYWFRNSIFRWLWCLWKFWLSKW